MLRSNCCAYSPFFHSLCLHAEREGDGRSKGGEDARSRGAGGAVADWGLCTIAVGLAFLDSRHIAKDFVSRAKLAIETLFLGRELARVVALGQCGIGSGSVVVHVAHGMLVGASAAVGIAALLCRDVAEVLRCRVREAQIRGCHYARVVALGQGGCRVRRCTTTGGFVALNGQVGASAAGRNAALHPSGVAEVLRCRVREAQIRGCHLARVVARGQGGCRVRRCTTSGGFVALNGLVGASAAVGDARGRHIAKVLLAVSSSKARSCVLRYARCVGGGDRGFGEGAAAYADVAKKLLSSASRVHIGRKGAREGNRKY